MANEILGRENRTIKRTALTIIKYSNLYTKEQIKAVYENITKDNRLSHETKVKLLDGLRKVYKQK